MKKLLLGTVLLAVLVAISYFQFERDSENKAQAFIDGHQVGVKSVELTQPNIDSLTGLVEQERAGRAEFEDAMSDSLAGRDYEYTATIDSLSGKIDSQQSEITSLKKQVATTAKATRTTTARKKSSSDKASHESILNHYKLAISKLPADLSTYEHRVALAEIEIETAEKFKITVDRLNQIKKQHNIQN